MKKFRWKYLKPKNKRNSCIFFAPYDGVYLSLIRVSCFNKKLRKDEFQFRWFSFGSNCLSWLDGEKALTLSWRRPLSYKNRSDWFLYDNGLRHERVKVTFVFRLQAEEFTIKCAEYGNTLFSYFDIFI